ncbi:hypothetical protein [Streptomyces sp. BE133]|uniref:hypothetical protein n=1 Tax=Streptomyces sp. BE133 TaxID=3002523 RepID=UPI002E779869|nr:hypothetical protein [Streptomyces sp. BE133]MEE1807234.1 hypothetical protein [Streptomyces sp. BE133]
MSPELFRSLEYPNLPTLAEKAGKTTQEHRTLQERLEGARSNLRFTDKRIADLEAQLLEQDHS